MAECVVNIIIVRLWHYIGIHEFSPFTLAQVNIGKLMKTPIFLL